jgi:hypothetical protein
MRSSEPASTAARGLREDSRPTLAQSAAIEYRVSARSPRRNSAVRSTEQIPRELLILTNRCQPDDHFRAEAERA